MKRQEIFTLSDIASNTVLESKFKAFLAAHAGSEQVWDEWLANSATDPTSVQKRKATQDQLAPLVHEFHTKELAMDVGSSEGLVLRTLGRDRSVSSMVESFKSGSLSDILEWLFVKCPEGQVQEEMVFFLFGYRCHLTADVLIEHLNKAQKNQRLWDFVSLWVNVCYDMDFRQKKDLLKSLLQLPQVPERLVDHITNLLMTQSTPLWTDFFAQHSNDNNNNDVSTTTMTMKESWSAQLIAQQMTVIDSCLFHGVHPDELLDNAWQGSDKHVRAPALAKLADQFNRVSYWVATHVLVQGTSRRQRAVELERFIDVMDQLAALRNYHGLMAVMSGLNNAAILRLKDEWDLVSPEKRAKFEAFEKLMEPLRNFKNYRDEIIRTAGMSRGLGVLPYVALHLRDVLFVEIGNPKKNLPIVNYEKTLLFGNAVSQLCFYQLFRYSLKVNDEVCKYLLNVSFLSEEELHNKSLEYRASEPLLSPSKSPRSGLKALKNSEPNDLVEKPNPVYGTVIKAADPYQAVAEASKQRSQATLPPAVTTIPSAASAPDATKAMSPRSGSKQSMMMNGNFLVIPKTEAESLAFVRSTDDEGFRHFIATCESRNLIMTQSMYLRFFVVDHCNEKKALKHVVNYWKFYETIAFKNLVIVDVTSALLSHILSPPLSPEWVDKEGRPIVVMRANLWFDGDPTQPSLVDLKKLLMWIGEHLSRTTHTQFTGFTFIMDMLGWTRKNFSGPVYTELMHMVQSSLPVRCEKFLFVDVPKVFSASWKMISASLRSDFKKTMIITTREDMVQQYVEPEALPSDLGGTSNASDINTFIGEMKKLEQADRGVPTVSPPADGKKALLQLSASEENFEEDVSKRPGVYALKIRSTASREASPRQGEGKTLITKDKKLGFFSGFRKKDKDGAKDKE